MSGGTRATALRLAEGGGPEGSYDFLMSGFDIRVRAAIIIQVRVASLLEG